MKPATAVVRTFRAKLERGASRLGWTIIRIPFDAGKIWGTRGQLRVKGEINGFGFRSSLFPDGRGGHTLLVNKRMQAGSGTAIGKIAQFRLEPDTEKRVATVPQELVALLQEDRSLRRWFDGLNHSTRRDIGNWVSEPKSQEARERRATQIAERLLNVMLAESGELPPILRMAFAGDAKAYAGWKRMPPSHRRGHLFGIFYYRTPEGQARRVEKTMEECRAYLAKNRRAEV